MNLFCKKTIIQLLSILFILVCASAQANQDSLLYRWVDKAGNVHYSDKVPPEDAGYRRDQINDQGVTVRTIERPKTPQEFAKERRLQKLRFQQKKLIEQQAARDRLLLFTFEDVTNSLGDKLAIIDTKLKIIKNSISQLNKQLKKQKKSAAQWEKNGRSVPQTVVFKISEIKNQINSYEASVKQHSEKREDLQKNYARDAQRYKKIVAHQHNKINAQKLLHASQNDDELSIATCTSNQECLKAWQLTKEYLINNPSGKKLITDSNLVMSTTAPANQNDIGVSAVLIKKTINQSTIFLDIHCKQTVVGQELCNSKDWKNWLYGFRTYVHSRLTISSSTKDKT
ncbi:MAG: DUF4124 domain-containing protein [Methylococcales bacterium]